MTHIMQGDAFALPIEFSSDGDNITADMLADIEVSIGSVLRKLLSTGGITEADNVFYVEVSQRETFLLRGSVDITARLKFVTGDVVGVKVDTWEVSPSTSKVVL